MQNYSDDKIIDLLNNGNVKFMKPIQRKQEYLNQVLVYVQLRFHFGNPGEARILDLQVLLPSAHDTNKSHDLTTEDTPSRNTTNHNGFISVKPVHYLTNQDGITTKEPVHLTNKEIAPFSEIPNKSEYCKPLKHKLKSSNISKKIDNISKDFACSHCDKKFKTKKLLKWHARRMHTIEKSHNCSYCSKGFVNSTSLKRHLRTHTGEKPFQCNQCNKAFSTHGIYKTHLKTHTGEKPFKCDYCDEAFSMKSNCSIHMIRKHMKETPHQCNKCEKGFLYERELKEHMNVHTGEKPFKCSHCEAGFHNKYDLQKHMKNRNSGKTHKCRHCVKTFCTKISLHRHMNDVHNGYQFQASYKCSMCEKSFEGIFSLNAHMNSHNGKNPSYKCSICEKSFKSIFTFNDHMDRHYEKKIQYPQFKNKFGPEKSLQIHIKDHDAEKPFKSQDCDEYFRYDKELQSHKQTHIKKQNQSNLCDKVYDNRKSILDLNMDHNYFVRPYYCQHCKKPFKNNDLMVNHIENNHINEVDQVCHSPPIPQKFGENLFEDISRTFSQGFEDIFKDMSRKFQDTG